ncbi:MAG: hypothetical protein ACNA8W_03920 [Bradymonadaceae bacterium]
MKHSFIFIAAALLIAMLSVWGCTSSAACQNSADCFLNELCIEGECRGETSSNTGGSNHEPPDGNTATNQDTSEPDEEDVPSNGDTSNHDAQIEAPAECLGDPFESCDDRDDESNVADTRNLALHSVFPDSNAGCPQNRDNFVPFEGGVFEGRLCTNEPADWFVFTVLDCRHTVVIAEVKIVLDHCPLEMMKTEIYQNGLHLDCEDERLQCSGADGEVMYRLLIPPASVRDIVRFYVGVMSPVEGARFDYDLHYRVYN